MDLKITDQREIFEKAYHQLNVHQKAAVDEIYGPVMVIAGPGTGKTQLLAVRVCNILDKTDVDASNILCLTYTDAGVTAMRNRLLRFMGGDAYKVGIFTYHSFCNQIIRENPEYFSDYRDLSNADELEITETIIDLMNALPSDHPNKRLSGEIYFDKSKWQNLFDTMKKEGWSPEFVHQKISEYEEIVREKSVHGVTKGNNRKGDFSQKKYDEVISKISFVRHGVDLLPVYDQMLKKKDKIDFNDSIIYVLNALKKHENLRFRYQEKYQFILADEYQDTNGTQNDLLFTLAQNDFDDQPNIFVVGDDDQSIYRFQGANLNNILEFKEKFHPKIIVLTHNYRSYQGILDSAKLLIDHNKQKINDFIKGLDKKLIESRRDNYGVGNPPALLAFANPVNHNYGVADLIKKIHERGVPYNEIAVIYQKHKEAEDIIKYLSFQNIPVSIKKRVDILSLKETNRILTLIRYVTEEMNNPFSMDRALFEILHYDFWGNDTLDLAKLSFYISRLPKEVKDKIYWREIIHDESFLTAAGITNKTSVIRTAAILEELFTAFNNTTIQVFFEVLLTKTGLYEDIILDPEKSWRLSIVNTLFDFMKNETARNPEITWNEIMARIDKMKDFNIPLQTNSILYKNNGINFMTAHGSKGLEFEEVIILNTSSVSWKVTTNNFNKVTFPSNILREDKDDTVEDYRRLFYVALTRAKNNAYLLFSKTDEKQKEISIHEFVKELGFEAEPPALINDEEGVLDYTATLLKYEKGELKLIDHDLIDLVTDNLVLNVTAINKYLDCPYKYYFENILRIPQARTARTGFGNAIHGALERYILLLNKDPHHQPPSLAVLQALFEENILKFKSHFTPMEFDNHLEEGKKICTHFHNKYVPGFSGVRAFKTELEVTAVCDEVPISGLIDRLDIYDTHIDVIDYKTGNYNNDDFQKPKEDKLAGKNLRQGIFYQILLGEDPNYKKYPVKSVFQYLKKQDVKPVIVEEDSELKEIVRGEIKEVYARIKAHDFNKGCDECEWCNLVKQHSR